MAQDDEEIPDYLKNLPPPSDEDHWQFIEDRFNELNRLISSIRLETKEQAVRQRQGVNTVDNGVYWYDNQIGVPVRSWLQIPYDPTRDEQHFQDIWQTAKSLATKVEKNIGDRNIDVEFLSNWGAFCQYASIVELEYLRDRPNLGYLKGGVRQSRDQHKLWFAHAFMQVRRNGDERGDTVGRVLEHLYELLEKDNFVESDFPKKWFKEFFTGDDITRAFQDTQFSLDEIARLAKEPIDNLPKNSFPTPRG